MPKVLLIEDDETMLSLLSTLLQLEGYEVARIERGASASQVLDRVREEKPTLILLDVHLQNLNGLDLLRSLRRDAQLSDTRVLMSSGMDLNHECIQAGANGFILKPYMPDELIQEIVAMIGT